MTQRFFRCLAGDSAYESIRLSLDGTWGHVAPMTCIDPASVAPRDGQGRVLLAVWSSFCEYPAVAAMLPDLLAEGVVEEITQEQYESGMVK